MMVISFLLAFLQKMEEFVCRCGLFLDHSYSIRFDVTSKSSPNFWSLLPVLEAQVKGFFAQTEGSHGNHRIDQRDGDEERLWGAERIRGELWKLGIRVCKRTIQKYMRTVRTPHPRGQQWATFVHNHAAGIWAYDILQVTDLFFRPLFAFFIIKHKSRKVIHVGVTRSPTDPWVAQQLQEATPYGQAPKYLSWLGFIMTTNGQPH